jgi:HTH-type transcriptional regulator, sugar sensing transcriptional regulator
LPTKYYNYKIMLKKQLEKLNLTPREAKVYLALLDLGEAGIEQISKKSKVKRTTVYDVIESLKEKGLIGAAKRKKRAFYFAEDPRILESQLEEKKAVLSGILPQLLSMANFIDKKPKIKYFEGVEGIKNVYKDTLNFPKQEILMWGSTDVFKYFDEDFMWNFYLAKRLEKRIWMRAVGEDSEVVRKIQADDKKNLRQTRLYKKDGLLSFEVEINLYGKNKIGIMSFKEQLGLIIESEKIFNTLKSIFELNWRMLEK